MTTRLVVIGGDAAGMSAAAQARRRATPDELEIVAFERGIYTSYAACGLPYLVSEEVESPRQLVARSPEAHRANGLDVRIRHEVTAIDVDARTVTVRDLDAERDRVEPYDRLVIATGANPIRPSLPGVDARGVHGIQTLGDGIDLRAHVDDHEAHQHRAVIVGAGYVGLEMAEALHQRGFAVTIVNGGSQPMPTLDLDMGELVAKAIRRLGIELVNDTRVVGFETDANGHVVAATTATATFPAALVVLGIGVRPNSGLALDAGVGIGAHGGITTDAHMATTTAGVWSAGDCVETNHRITGKPVAIALGTHANKQGRIVGLNVTGGDATFPGVIGTAVTKICAYEIGRTGLTEREAATHGFDCVASKIDGTTRASYYPGGSPITVKVVAERSTGRLLGAQIIGREGAAKRIDVLAAAIWNEMTAADFSQLDLGYAPPFSPVWDPTLIAARKVADQLV